jgi:hypothetical protein
MRARGYRLCAWTYAKEISAARERGEENPGPAILRRRRIASEAASLLRRRPKSAQDSVGRSPNRGDVSLLRCRGKVTFEFPEGGFLISGIRGANWTPCSIILRGGSEGGPPGIAVQLLRYAGTGLRVPRRRRDSSVESPSRRAKTVPPRQRPLPRHMTGVARTRSYIAKPLYV